jgi:hypothetical protein
MLFSNDIRAVRVIFNKVIFSLKQLLFKTSVVTLV